MRKVSKAFGLVALLPLVAGCVNYDGSVKVSDIRKEETLVLKNKHSPKHVYAIDIRGSGKIAGDATIILMLNGKPYKIEKLQGVVGFKWAGDWYSDTAEIHYQPQAVKAGELLLEYNFSTL